MSILTGLGRANTCRVRCGMLEFPNAEAGHKVVDYLMALPVPGDVRRDLAGHVLGHVLTLDTQILPGATLEFHPRAGEPEPPTEDEVVEVLMLAERVLLATGDNSTPTPVCRRERLPRHVNTCEARGSSTKSRVPFRPLTSGFGRP
jgi:hypothetical protein